MVIPNLKDVSEEMENENMNDKAEDTKEAKKEEAKETTEAQPTVEAKKEEVDFKAKYFYIAAEMDNYRKRMEREKENLLKFGNERVLSDLLQVVDNFDRTIDMLKPDQDPKMKNIVIGLDMVKKQFIDALSKHGLTPVDSVGKEFDPNFHEAMAQEYAEGAKPNHIIKEFQKGYTLNGRLIRPSKVVVASDKQ
jgi:molecular chaperone GrpE